MGVNNWPCCLSLRGFPEQGTFNFKTGKVRRKTGWAGHPMCSDLTKSHHQGVSDMAIKAVVRHYLSEYLWWWGCWAVIFLKAPSNHLGKGAGSKWLSWGRMAVLVNWSLRRQKGREGMEREGVVFQWLQPAPHPHCFWSLVFPGLEGTFLCQSIPLQWGSAEVGD